jgi:putative (di)nucleoside polyphosphate hydrolase
MLLNRLGQVFVAQRIDSPGAWQMPQGGVDGTESPREAALRELEEETGIGNARILAQSRDWIRYDLPSDLVPNVWGGGYRGQEQMWFAMAFEGEDSDIDIATEHPEFSAWRWAEMEDLPDLIVDFKRPLYEAVVEEFRELVEGLRQG